VTPSTATSTPPIASAGPDPVHALTDDFLAWRLDNEWYLRLQTGVPLDRLPNFGIDEAEAQASIASGFLDRITRLSATTAGTDADDTLGYLAAIARRVRTEAQHYWLLPIVTPYRLSDLTVMLDLVLGQFAFDAAEDVDRYLALVSQLAKSIQSVAQKISGQAARGIYLADAAYPGAAATLNGFATGLANQLVPSQARLTALGDRDRRRLVDHAAALTSTSIAQGVGAAHSALERHRDRLSDQVGLHQYPNGLDAYLDLVRIETTMDLDADVVRKVGIEECRTIADKMRQVRGRIGFVGNEAEFHTQLEHEPRLYAADSREVAARFERYIDRVEQHAADYFAVLPATPYGVARLDAALEGGMTFGYYEPATRAQPVGLYRFNGSSLATRSLLTAAAVIYHELIPGHHFHVARQAENQQLHPLRRHMFFNVSPAYMEGWAEYAADLGWSMGLYDDPWDAYGRLAQERLTATRLVVDTAMNTGRWDLSEARTFMRQNVVDTEPQIVTESLRYATDVPAQALAYRTGYRAFTRLRERAQSALGARFDERDFHEWVIECGTLPIPTLEARVQRRLAVARAADGSADSGGR
jgi:uncharacterized protein (DUF885 family)